MDAPSDNTPPTPNPNPVKYAPKRLADGKWAKGSSGHPGGNRHRARQELNEATIRELHAAFRRGGRKAIDRVMRNQPAMFLKMLVFLVPRELQLEHSGSIKQMSDQQIEDCIAAIEGMLARQAAGENARVIEGVSEPVPTPALPAPQRKRRKAEGVSATEPHTARPGRAEDDGVS